MSWTQNPKNAEANRRAWIKRQQTSANRHAGQGKIIDVTPIDVTTMYYLEEHLKTLSRALHAAIETCEAISTLSNLGALEDSTLADMGSHLQEAFEAAKTYQERVVEYRQSDAFREEFLESYGCEPT